ncbi:hypothetical protein [Sphingosinicella sp. BN140058]|uniref:hypothetical protein n=1 Tax=Sphingosinicella sp. BN140058 TaxID=1892855 RepID=UPI0010116318|nr:hypothetical protein [Sphingosinicella sp. BN140058]QAY79047.1 hypothetical protein ETR14_22780 [Sphingosinicella sp. BN140058]
MLIGLLFWLLAGLSCGYAIVFGGKDGRWAAFLIIAAALMTIPAARVGRAWGSTEMAIFAVDSVLLFGFYGLMLASRRFWPIWITGFHLIAVATHFSTMLAPAFTPAIYRALESMWAIPIQLTLLLGVELDRRAAKRPLSP